MRPRLFLKKNQKVRDLVRVMEHSNAPIQHPPSQQAISDYQNTTICDEGDSIKNGAASLPADISRILTRQLRMENNGGHHQHDAAAFSDCSTDEEIGNIIGRKCFF